MRSGFVTCLNITLYWQHIRCISAIVTVEVPPHVQRGADVTVDITRKHLRVSYKDADGKPVDVIDGELTWDVHKDESMWSLVPREHVHVSLMCSATQCYKVL